MYSPNSKHSKSGIHGGERSKVFDINSHQLHSHWPLVHICRDGLPPIPPPPSISTPGYTKSDGDPPLFSTPGYTNALAIHAPLTSIWTQSIDLATIMRIRIETAKVRAIFKWVCWISMIGRKNSQKWPIYEYYIECVMISMWFLSMGDIFYQIWLPFQVLLILPLLRDIVRDQWRLLAIGIWSNTPN